MRRPTLHRFENLESRLAMAALATFTDVDGDTVTVQSSRGTNALLQSSLTLVPTGGLGGMQLRQIVLNNGAFARTNLSITARPSGLGGNGQVDVGMIMTNVDLGTVTVGGDLGKIVAGDANSRTPGVASLLVGSIGVLSTLIGADDTRSSINGPLRTLRVQGDFVGARLDVRGRVFDATIGGSLIGGAVDGGLRAASIGRIVVTAGIFGGNVDDSGVIEATVGIDRLLVGFGVIGGLGDRSGAVTCRGRIGQAQINGSIVGGDGDQSGGIMCGGITRLVVTGDIDGRNGVSSGFVASYGSVGTATVGGTLNGGGTIQSGSLFGTSFGTLTVGAIRGSLGDVSGSVASLGRIGTLRVGNIWAGDGRRSGCVFAATIGAFVVQGDISGTASQPVEIVTTGLRNPSGPRAITSLTVGGNLVRTTIAAGYSSDSAVNGSARIGSVTVGGNMAASSIVAGVQNTVTPLVFGSLRESIIPGGRGSRIDSLVVRGTVGGSTVPGETFGIHASAIGRVQVGGMTYRPTTAPVMPSGDNLMIRLV